MTTYTTNCTCRTTRTQPAYATLHIKPSKTTIWTYNPVHQSGSIPTRRTP